MKRVDPDNRGDVDLDAHRRALRDLTDAAIPHIAGDLGRMKMHTVRRVLGLRRRSPSSFDGPYRALTAAGPHAHRVFAFSRGAELVTVVPRIAMHANGWRDTTLALPDGSWRDILSDRTVGTGGGQVAVAELWRELPIALLARA